MRGKIQKGRVFVLKVAEMWGFVLKVAEMRVFSLKVADM